MQRESPVQAKEERNSAETTRGTPDTETEVASTTTAGSSQEEHIDLVFECKIEKVQTIANILNAINISKERTVCFFQFNIF